MKLSKPFVISSIALAIHAAFNPAYAEENEPEATTRQETAETSEENQLGSITVTARRRTEKEQDVPAPISVVKGEQLEATKIYQVQDLQQLLPNFTSQFIHARQSSVAVRGIGNNTANEGLEGSVGIYLDNVYLGRPGQAVFDLLDIEQIDLLRGPQGTLFGKNTTAGVLNITSRQPVFKEERTIEVSGGERGYRQLKAMINQPLSDNVAVRISAYDTHDDGWIKNTYNGKDLNEINRQGVRGQILIKPSETFSLRLIGEHNEEDSSTGTLIPYSFGPWRPNGMTYAQNATSLGAVNIARSPYDYKVDFDARQRSKVNQDALSAEANWDINGYKLTSITAWRDWKFSPENDLDFTRLPGLVGGFKVKEEQYSQEIRLASPLGEIYDYVVGAFYYHQNIDSDNGYSTGPISLPLSLTYPGNSSLQGQGTAKTDSYAVFGQATWHTTEKLDLTAGLRYTLEKKEGRVDQQLISPASNIIYHPQLFGAYDSGTLRRKDESIAGLLTASYRFTDDILSFATYSTGEKSGGFNVNSVASPGSVFGSQALRIDPEKAHNLELGLKTSWLDNRLHINTNLFLTKISDYQAVTTAESGGAYLPLLTNVGDLTSKGVELDIKAQPTSHLALTFNAAYTDATFDRGTAPTPFEEFDGVGYGRGVRSIAGNRVNGAPRWTANAGVFHQWNINGSVEHYTSANYGWRSETYADVNNSTYSKIPSYGVFNLTTGFKIPHGNNQWDISIWAKNLFDKHYFLGLVNSGFGMYAGSAAQPRTIGASLRYDF
ncbi:TonB-dependent receptor [Methylobacillus flagellatus]|uniref:TonB-dependent receptor n=1 Tax=Methylobacillus flagellatus TaxID=405 RepID=UPI0028539E31|nr:TonB-dependent receptor [Methylobacillus flagellatus]MDR5170947.1 TonB-dependent receptor [Methylobacillus flagellatus]